MLPTASVGPTIAALVFRARRKIRAHFFAHNAVTPEDAVAFTPDRAIMRRQFDRMRARGVVRDAAPGTYWLDTMAWQRDEDRRRRIIIPAVLVVIFAAAAVPLFFYRG